MKTKNSQRKQSYPQTTCHTNLKEAVDITTDRVKDFMVMAGQHISAYPKVAPLAVAALRKRLIEEEVKELTDAIQHGDLVEIADGLADLLYVAYGTAIAYGIPLGDVFNAVHENNLSKLWTTEQFLHQAPEGAAATRLNGYSLLRVTLDGKLLKPPSHPRPNIQAILVNSSI